MKDILGIFIVVLLLGACSSQEVSSLSEDSPIRLKVPQGFGKINFPEGNEPTELRIRLGRILFYDNRLSLTNTVNCGTCHILSVAFTDGKQISEGISLGTRNAPTLANVAWSPYYMMEGGVPTLEAQSLAPLHDITEMGENMMVAIEKLNKDESLRNLAKAAYKRDSIDPFVVTRALANFQRTFISGDSYYDRFIHGNKEALSEQAVRGKDLFFSDRTMCSTCHSGNFFTDYSFHNTGLYDSYQDLGKERQTGEDKDNGRFKTPTLRNIALTAPYMHDGSVNTLEEVVARYNSGGKNHRNKDSRIKPLHMTSQEQSDLVAFLESLTDWNFVQNKQLLPLE